MISEVSHFSQDIQETTSLLEDVIDVAIMIITELGYMFYCGVIQFFGDQENYHVYDLNPKFLTEEQKQLPATLLLHGCGGDQSTWRWLASKVQTVATAGPLFTVNMPDSDDKWEHPEIKQRISEIKALYGKDIDLNFVGHSLGGTRAVDFALNESLQGVTIKKVITVSSRLRIVIPKNWFFNLWFGYLWWGQYYDIVDRVNELYGKLQTTKYDFEFYNVMAVQDWLVPKDSGLVNHDLSKRHIVRARGHLGVLFNSTDKIVEYLFSEVPKEESSTDFEWYSDLVEFGSFFWMNIVNPALRFSVL